MATFHSIHSTTANISSQTRHDTLYSKNATFYWAR